MMNNELNRMELLKGIKGYGKMDVVVGVTVNGIYQLNIDVTKDYFSMSSDIYTPFNTDINDEDLFDFVEFILEDYGFNINLERFLEGVNVYKSDIIEKYLETMCEDEKLEILHNDLLVGSEFDYNGENYMLELAQCGQSYLDEHEFIYNIVEEEEREQLQNLWNKAHLKDIEVLNDNELRFLYNFMKRYENSESVIDVLANNEIAETLVEEIKF